MHKIERRAESLATAVFVYDMVKNSSTSWRRKSSYRKPIKRRISKLLRREQKYALMNRTED